jgi:hypothetical protein
MLRIKASLAGIASPIPRPEVRGLNPLSSTKEVLISGGSQGCILFSQAFAAEGAVVVAVR